MSYATGTIDTVTTEILRLVSRRGGGPPGWEPLVYLIAGSRTHAGGRAGGRAGLHGLWSVGGYRNDRIISSDDDEPRPRQQSGIPNLPSADATRTLARRDPVPAGRRRRADRGLRRTRRNEEIPAVGRVRAHAHKQNARSLRLRSRRENPKTEVFFFSSRRYYIIRVTGRTYRYFCLVVNIDHSRTYVLCARDRGVYCVCYYIILCLSIGRHPPPPLLFSPNPFGQCVFPFYRYVVVYILRVFRRGHNREKYGKW